MYETAKLEQACFCAFHPLRYYASSFCHLKANGFALVEA